MLTRQRPDQSATRRRLGATTPALLEALGYLQDLPGTWRGRGFNMITRPRRLANPDFFLQMNTTIDQITFSPVAGAVPNRGSVQDDIFLHTVTYLQQVSDLPTGAGLHVEPGLWVSVPPTSDPDQPETLVRQATIPHGDALVAQSTLLSEMATPRIDPVDTRPFRIVTERRSPASTR